MIATYSVSLVLGVVVFGWWIVAEAGRGSSPLAEPVRRAVAGLTAFGIGGMSASFSGLNAAVSFALASMAAAAMVVYTDRASADADR